MTGWTQNEPQRVSVLWTLMKPGAVATAELWLAPYGWEVRLISNDIQIAVSIGYAVVEVQAITDEWRDRMLSEGWAMGPQGSGDRAT